MKFILQPWQLMLIILASWVNRQQQEVIDYLRTENAVLKEKFGKKRILLTDDQRHRLAVKGKILGRRQLEQIGTLFTPDTILRWHRQLVAKKWDYSDRKENQPGRPRIRQVNVDLTVKFAKENPTWGYDLICGALIRKRSQRSGHEVRFNDSLGPCCRYSFHKCRSPPVSRFHRDRRQQRQSFPEVRRHFDVAFACQIAPFLRESACRLYHDQRHPMQTKIGQESGSVC